MRVFRPCSRFVYYPVSFEMAEVARPRLIVYPLGYVYLSPLTPVSSLIDFLWNLRPRRGPDRLRKADRGVRRILGAVRGSSFGRLRPNFLRYREGVAGDPAWS